MVQYRCGERGEGVMVQCRCGGRGEGVMVQCRCGGRGEGVMVQWSMYICVEGERGCDGIYSAVWREKGGCGGTFRVCVCVCACVCNKPNQVYGF